VSVNRLALLGGATGGASALAILAFNRLVEAPGGELFGVCIGIRLFAMCNGADLTVYVAPGLVFGVVFAGAFLASRRVALPGGLVLCLGSVIANTVAVAASLATRDIVGHVVAGPVQLAITGAIGGAVGGGLLALSLRRLLTPAGARRLGAIGAALGLLLPLWETGAGMVAFYILWQAGYAAALAAALRRLG
jgi:hypothetical protein